MEEAKSLSATHSARVICLFAGSYIQGERMMRRPAEG